MKTLQEFYEEIKTSDDLKKELSEAVKAGKVTEFLKANGCDSTADELKEFVAEKTAQNKALRELSLDELEMVAGGSQDLGEHDENQKATLDSYVCC